jgi:hypothetical protein
VSSKQDYHTNHYRQGLTYNIYTHAVLILRHEEIMPYKRKKLTNRIYVHSHEFVKNSEREETSVRTLHILGKRELGKLEVFLSCKFRKL